MTEAPDDARVMAAAYESLRKGSKTFSLASQLLSPDARRRAAALYAYCRHVDDQIDDAPVGRQEVHLSQLHAELDALTRPVAGDESLAFRALRAVQRDARIPEPYLRELLWGMGMDTRGVRYDALEDLLLYCHRVAAVVGLMMCHVLGVTRDAALQPAAHLGIAMQLTNICRDVAEDLRLGRLYLPQRLLGPSGPHLLAAASDAVPLDASSRADAASAMGILLDEAERYYASAERAIVLLPFRAGLGVRAALRLYRAIGRIVRRHHCDITRRRAVVGPMHKAWLVAGAIFAHLRSIPSYLRERSRAPGGHRPPSAVLSFPEDVLTPFHSRIALDSAQAARIEASPANALTSRQERAVRYRTG